MNEKVFVDGSIVIKTPFFKYQNAGCLYSYPPEGAEIIIPNDEIDGYRCLIITEEKAPSFFKEYYARGEFAVICDWAPFFDLTIYKCFDSFENKLTEVIQLLEYNDVYPPNSAQLYRLVLLSAVASLDTLISDLVLYISTKDRTYFLNVIGHLVLSSKKCFQLMTRINKMWCDNIIDSAEQEVINLILKKSYTSLDEIKDILKDIYGIAVNFPKGLSEIITIRHLIAHRNGRRKDGNNIELTKENLLSMVEVIREFVAQLKQKLEYT